MAGKVRPIFYQLYGPINGQVAAPVEDDLTSPPPAGEHAFARQLTCP
jgi:hypothetical protein